MRLKLLTSALLMSTAVAFAQTTGMTYEQLAAKAERFFDGREWGTSGAIYGIMLDQRGNTPEIYGRAIVSAEMMADTARVEQLFHQSMTHGVAFESTFMSVEQSALDAGEASIYPLFLTQARQMYPYLSRQINQFLLRYYDRHNNGAAIVDYASRMLEGIPDNTDYLRLLARGYVLLDNMGAAVATWEHMLRVDPDNRNALLCLGNYYMLAGERTRALPYLEHAQKLYPSPFLENLINRK